jgi:branched-chain amino acid transport system ATP-binding protein
MPGEIVAPGANGAGKTTFLNTVMGLVTMTSGRVFHDGPTSRTARRRSAASGIALSRGRHVFAKMTVEEISVSAPD